MSFNIVMAEKITEFLGEPVLEGYIELAGDIEYFHAPVSFWTREQYIESWKRSFSEGYAGKKHSALIVSMRDPLQTNFLFLWVLYFEGVKVFVQNKILFLDEIGEVFEQEKVNDYIGERVKVNYEGVKISEWEIEHDEVFGFFTNLASA